MRAQARGRRDPESPGSTACKILAKSLDPLHALPRELDLREQGQRLCRGQQPSLHRLEQADPAPALNVMRHAADGRLRNAEQLGGTSDGPGEHEGPKDLDLA